MRLLARNYVMLAADGTEESEIQPVRRFLEREGAELLLTTSQSVPYITTYVGRMQGECVCIDIPLELIDARVMDGVLIAGGAVCAEAIYTDPAAVRLLERFIALGKPTVLSPEIKEWVAEDMCTEDNVHIVPFSDNAWRDRLLEALLSDTSTHSRREGISRFESQKIKYKQYASKVNI